MDPLDCRAVQSALRCVCCDMHRGELQQGESRQMPRSTVRRWLVRVTCAYHPSFQFLRGLLCFCAAAFSICLLRGYVCARLLPPRTSHIGGSVSGLFWPHPHACSCLHASLVFLCQVGILARGACFVLLLEVFSSGGSGRARRVVSVFLPPRCRVMSTFTSVPVMDRACPFRSRRA